MNLFISIVLLLQLFIQDVNTHEKLAGVRVVTKSGVYYTDINGRVLIPSADTTSKIVVNYISYQDVVVSLHSDTLLSLVPKVPPTR